MSLKEKFEAIKSAIHNAMNFAEPAAVLEKAEHEFKEGVIAEFDAIKERLDALEWKPLPVELAPATASVMTPEQVAVALPPADVATANVESVPPGVGLTEPEAPAA